MATYCTHGGSVESFTWEVSQQGFGDFQALVEISARSPHGSVDWGNSVRSFLSQEACASTSFLHRAAKPETFFKPPLLGVWVCLGLGFRV